MNNGRRNQAKTQITGHTKGAKRRIMLREGSDKESGSEDSNKSYLRGFREPPEEEEEREGQESKEEGMEM